MQGQFYNRYNTPLTEEERRGLYEYLMELSLQTGRNAYNDLNDYDMAGAYLAGNFADGNGHFPDTYKKPNHPTFSDESQYHGTDGYYGGRWTESTFTPSEWNLENMPPEQMRRYFDSVEPNIELILPREQRGQEDGGNNMAVIYAPQQNSGGGLGRGLGIVGTLLSFVPGMQGVGQGMAALGAAASGNYTGAAKSLAGLNGGTNAATNAAANTAIPQLSGSSADELQSMYHDYNRWNR